LFVGIEGGSEFKGKESEPLLLMLIFYV